MVYHTYAQVFFFQQFLDSLMRIVEQRVGDAFDKAAWENCGGYLMEAMH